jgi:hypothetical protein
MRLIPRTESGIALPLPANLDSFSFSLHYSEKDSRNSKRISVPFESYYRPPVYSEGFVVLEPFKSIKANLQVGVITITVVYTEMRPDILSLFTSEESRETQADIKCVLTAGPPHSITLDSAIAGKLENVTVSNKSALTSRLIADNVYVNVKDECDNKALLSDEFRGNYRIACKIAIKPPSLTQSNKEYQITSIPKLQGASDHGLLFSGPYDDVKKRYHFPRIEIVCATGSGEGKMILIFFVVSVNDGTVLDGISPEHITFYFTSDEQRALRKQAIRDKISPLNEKIHTYDTRHRELTTALSSVNREIKSILNNASSAQLITFRNEPEKFNLNDLENIESDIRRQLADMVDSRTQPRVAKKRRNWPNPAALGTFETIGLVTDLGFVEDYERAFILSWAAKAYMDTMVVHDQATAKELYDNRVKVWALSDIVSYSSGSGGRYIF